MFDQRRSVTTTLLDTFDGRLHRAGLKLELHESNGLELVLSGDQTVPAHLAVDCSTSSARRPARPARFVPDSQRSPTCGHCCLSFVSAPRRRRASRRDSTGGVVATAQLHERDPRRRSARDQLSGSNRRDPRAHRLHRRARQAVEVLDEVGLPQCETDTLSQCAAAAQVDLAGFSASATVPLESATPAIDGIRAVLANLAVAIVANWQGTIDQSDPEFLHDLRIAVRRTRTVIAESKGVLPATVRDQARDGFAWLGGLTGPARDLDVYLIEWGSYTGPLGARWSRRLRRCGRSSNAAAPTRTSTSSGPSDPSGQRTSCEPGRRGSASPIDGRTPRTASRATHRAAGRGADRPCSRRVDRGWSADRPRLAGRAGPRPAQGRQEAPLPAGVLRQPGARRAAQTVREASQGTPGQPRRASGRRGARLDAARRRARAATTQARRPTR